MAFILNPSKVKNNSDKLNAQAQAREIEQYEQVFCTVDRIVFVSKTDGFFVFAASLIEDAPNLRMTVNDQTFFGRKFTAVGNSLLFVEAVGEKQEVELRGNFGIGRDGGLQFNVKDIKERIPTKPKAIEIFLASGKIAGIGPGTARKIVTKYGPETLKILDHAPEQLLEIDGISERKLEGIIQSWKAYRAIYDVISTMSIYRIGNAEGLRIYNYFKEKTIPVIQNDPYKLTDVPKIGFKTADRIAQAIGISPVDPKRIRSGLLYTLESLSDEEGHTAYPSQGLVERANEVLMVEPELIQKHIDEMCASGELVSKPILLTKVEKGKAPTSEDVHGVAHKKLHNTEERIAKELLRVGHGASWQETSSQMSEAQYLAKAEVFLNSNIDGLDDSQLKAAHNILLNKVSILTGGPGTGKTHTLKSVISFFEKMGRKVVLSAPTGRAAKRMEEATGRSSSTMHRVLGFAEGGFRHNENNKLSGHVFVCDESSMIDIYLQNGFLKALPDGATLLQVGDIDQLPSVGAGNVLRDIIESGKFAVNRLTTIHRQAQNSQIILASHDIIHNRSPILHKLDSSSDFVFIEKDNNIDIMNEVLNLSKNLVGSGVKPEDIQILSPQKNTEVGTTSLNTHLRAVLNTEYKGELVDEDTLKFKLFPGDRVMQQRNNYDLDIFNGDIGKVLSVDRNKAEVLVNFDGKEVMVKGQEIGDLKSAYAITVHKSQGSDYPHVIIPLSRSHIFMWDVNLLYTAVTRGKSRVYLVGDKQVLLFAVAKFRQNFRTTGLRRSIESAYNNVNLRAAPSPF